MEKKNELLNKTLEERKEILEAYLSNEFLKTLNSTVECLDNIECVQDVEKMVEANIEWVYATKQTASKRLGFTMEEIEEIIEELGIEEIDFKSIEGKVEAKKRELIDKNLEIFENISYEERWANDMRFITTKEEFDKYEEYLIVTYNADKEFRGDFEGIGYYDYKWDTWAIRIAGLDYFYEEEIREEIKNMDERVKVIRERKLDRQIEAYMKTLPVKRYEYTMDFKSIRNGADGIDRLENFLKEARKHAFVFHEQVSSEEWKNEKINKDYIQMNGNISDFSFVYYIEEDKQQVFEFDIIGLYKSGMEEFIGQGRTF